MTIELDVPPLPQGYNSWLHTEKMVQVRGCWRGCCWGPGRSLMLVLLRGCGWQACAAAHTGLEGRAALPRHVAQVHLSAMQHQLTQLYYAFALALATNRTLIMPRLQ